MKQRTNIELEMDYVEEIMRRFSFRTKTDAVNYALRHLAGSIPMTREEALAMEGAHILDEIPEEPPLEEL